MKEINVKNLKITLPEGLETVAPAKLIEEGVVELRVQATKTVDTASGITAGYGDTDVVSGPEVQTLPKVNLVNVENTGGDTPGLLVGSKLIFDGKVKANLLKVETKGGVRVKELYDNKDTNISLKIQLPITANTDWSVSAKYPGVDLITVRGKTKMPTQAALTFTPDKPNPTVGDVVVFTVEYKEPADFIDRPRTISTTEGLKFKEDWAKSGNKYTTSYTVTSEGDQNIYIVVHENMIHQQRFIAKVKASAAAVSPASRQKQAK